MTRISIVLQIKHRMVHYLVIEPTPCIAIKYILPVVHQGNRLSVTCSFTLFTSRYHSFLPIPWTNRLAVGSKHLNLFTREEQANSFSASYKTLDVHTTTLRNLGNFKGALLDSIRKIHGIKKPRAFQLLKDGDQQVTVGMKEFMHHERFTGMTREGVFGGPPHELFIGSIPKVEDAPLSSSRRLTRSLWTRFSNATTASTRGWRRYTPMVRYAASVWLCTLADWLTVSRGKKHSCTVSCFVSPPVNLSAKKHSLFNFPRGDRFS